MQWLFREKARLFWMNEYDEWTSKVLDSIDASLEENSSQTHLFIHRNRVFINWRRKMNYASSTDVALRLPKGGHFPFGFSTRTIIINNDVSWNLWATEIGRTGQQHCLFTHIKPFCFLLSPIPVEIVCKWFQRPPRLIPKSEKRKLNYVFRVSVAFLRSLRNIFIQNAGKYISTFYKNKYFSF